jgi:hypothetical protein
VRGTRTSSTPSRKGRGKEGGAFSHHHPAAHCCQCDEQSLHIADHREPRKQQLGPACRHGEGAGHRRHFNGHHLAVQEALLEGTLTVLVLSYQRRMISSNKRAAFHCFLSWIMEVISRRWYHVAAGAPAVCKRYQGGNHRRQAFQINSLQSNQKTLNKAKRKYDPKTSMPNQPQVDCKGK